MKALSLTKKQYKSFDKFKKAAKEFDSTFQTRISDTQMIEVFDSSIIGEEGIIYKLYTFWASAASPDVKLITEREAKELIENTEWSKNK